MIESQTITENQSRFSSPKKKRNIFFLTRSAIRRIFIQDRRDITYIKQLKKLKEIRNSIKKHNIKKNNIKKNNIKKKNNTI